MEARVASSAPGRDQCRPGRPSYPKLLASVNVFKGACWVVVVVDGRLKRLSVRRRRSGVEGAESPSCAHAYE